MTGLSTSQDNYEFEIEAMNTAGATSSPATLVVLGSPTLTAVSDTQVSISWQDLPNAAGYVLQRSDNGGFTWSTVNTTGAVTTAGVTSSPIPASAAARPTNIGDGYVFRRRVGCEPPAAVAPRRVVSRPPMSRETRSI